MLAYLVLAGNGGAPVDPDLIARFDQDDPPEAPFHPEERIVWRNHDGSIVFFGWQAFTEVAGIGSHWTVGERGLTAFTGHCWPKETGWDHGTDRSWAQQLRAWLGDEPNLPALRESLFGQFTILSLPARGTGWAMPDWISFDQLFVADLDGSTAVSNRAGFCARAATPCGTAPERSLTGIGWLICEGWMLDEETSYWEVDRPMAGSSVVIRPGQGARVIEPAHSPMLPPAPEDPAPAYEELLDEVDRDVRANLRAIAALPIDDRVLLLSAGKDSRTLTAMLIDEGLADRFRYETHGSPERPDAIGASAVAARFGLNWSLEDATDRAPEDELDILLLHTGLTEGMNSGWSTYKRPVFAPHAIVSGVGGEGIRWGPLSRTGIGASDVDEVLKRVWKFRPLDRMGVVRPDIRAYYQNAIREWAHRQADVGTPLVSIPNLYGEEFALHSRNGPDHSWSPRMRINPFITPSCQRANHRLPVDRRPNIRFQLDLMRRVAPELSKIPFPGWAWPEAAFAHLPDAEDYRRIEPISTPSPDGRTWRQKRYADYLPFIEEIVLDRDNPIHELLDYDRLVERLATGDRNAGRTRLVWGVLTAAVWMGRHESVIKLVRESRLVGSSQ